MNVKNVLFINIAFLLLASLCTGCSRQEPETFCDDRAGLLETDRQERLQNFHRRLREDIDIHLLLVVLDRRAQDLDAEAVALFDKYRVGAGTSGARGVLLVVDPEGRQVRLEIGYDLEGIFSDGFVGMIEHEQMAPFFAAGRVADGIEATVELLVAQALGVGQDGSEGRGRKVGERLSGGGGARIDVAIGTGGHQTGQAGTFGKFPAGGSPEEVFATYLRVLQSRIKEPELPLYTTETRALLHNWLVTDAQQGHELKNLTSAAAQGAWSVSGNLAVLRFPLTERQLPPYFFQHADAGWQLDLAAMSQLVAFNHLNQWHFRRLDHPYMFAFGDVAFDTNGFPQPAH
jgi:hypothetical protein